ncbi:MAG: 50S ribosomal protein L15 [Anaerolineae bacterium]
MKLHELRPPKGAKRKRKRVARGHAAGQGKTAGRGTKGQKARSGGGVRPYFEGGQLPLVQRLPQKRGFHNPFKKEYAIVNVERLNEGFEAGTQVSPQALVEAGVIKSATLPVKVLGRGRLEKPLTVRAHAFSHTARSKIEAAGGEIEVLEFKWVRGRR